MTRETMHVVSVSSGKDSVATLGLALELHPRDRVRAVFADTGNEHELVHEHLAHLERRLDIHIIRLRRDFTDWWWHRRNYIAQKWPLPHKDWPKGVPDETIRRALSVFDKGPTGNPYLDLCIIKGRFPSRRAQFCTQFLKTEPMVEYQLDLVAQGFAVWSWQGIRREEGGRRARAKEFEPVAADYVAMPLFTYRPILRWTAADTFEAHRAMGVEPNPLYKLGMGRVGCMPCINANKEEIGAIAKRFPEHMDRLEEWEAAVSAGSKRGGSSFFPAPEDGRADRVGRNIRQVIQWSRTSRGGKQVSIFADDAPSACASSYGLCDEAA